MGRPIVNWELMSEDPAKVSGLLREDLRRLWKQTKK